jgi:hypothetical protein
MERKNVYFDIGWFRAVSQTRYPLWIHFFSVAIYIYSESPATGMEMGIPLGSEVYNLNRGKDFRQNVTKI